MPHIVSFPTMRASCGHHYNPFVYIETLPWRGRTLPRKQQHSFTPQAARTTLSWHEQRKEQVDACVVRSGRVMWKSIDSYLYTKSNIQAKGVHLEISPQPTLHLVPLLIQIVLPNPIKPCPQMLPQPLPILLTHASELVRVTGLQTRFQHFVCSW